VRGLTQRPIVKMLSYGTAAILPGVGPRGGRLTTLENHSHSCPLRQGAIMQRLAEYLERARQFERLAAEETNPEIKAQFEKQAESYRNIAERRQRFLRDVQPKFSD
jgi:hypothetical protein